jgi:predicted ribosome quality control (RQC) complex YloA/Tae2 family protein
MLAKLDVRKSAMQNASAYFDKAKTLRAKAEGLRDAIAKTKLELKSAEHESAQAKSKASVRRREKAWHEKFRFFLTSGGKLAIGGRDAKQNDTVFLRHCSDGDLFFHADIQGASAIILKDGEKAPVQEKKEAAAFAASYSNAWKNGSSTVDVYCLPKSGVSKHSNEGYIPQGGFALLGQREWFRATPLGLKIGIENGIAIALPYNHPKKLEKEHLLSPGKDEKGAAAKKLAKIYGISADELILLLPAGKTTIKRE